MSIMLSPDSQRNNRGWRANDLTPDDVAHLLDRFIAKFEPGAPDECWLWHGGRFASGYGQISNRPGPALLAHRVSWVAFTGRALTNQLTIDHLCNVRLCVNPDHLEPVTLSENQRRKSERLGWVVGSRTGARVVCDECGITLRGDGLRRHSRRMHSVAA